MAGLEASPLRAHRQGQLGESLFGRSQASLKEMREQFEGKEDYETLRMRLKKSRPGTGAHAPEVGRFLSMMREKGGGSIALAWRRYFDGDGDGELSFIEFCRALASLGYKGDVPRLWRDLGGSVSNALGLEALDPDNAAILETFRGWCDVTLGGPIEVFRAIDADMSDSLTADEFAEGLRELDFFEFPGLSETLATEKLILANLYPLLDQGGHGCITPDQLLFLEKDKEKRARIERQLARIREHGTDGAPEPLRKDAERFLRSLSHQTTYLGGSHWKYIEDSVIEDPSSCCDLDDPQRVRRSVKGFGRTCRASLRSGSGAGPLRGSKSSGSLMLPSAFRTDAQAMQAVRGASQRNSLSRASSGSAVTSLPALEGSCQA